MEAGPTHQTRAVDIEQISPEITVVPSKQKQPSPLWSIIIIVIVIIGAAFYFLNKPQQPQVSLKELPSPTLTATPLSTVTSTPLTDEKPLLASEIRRSLALKYSIDEKSLTVTVSTIEGNYAKGMVTENGGGGMWFAAKEGGLWKLVTDGNGIIQCSALKSYPNFPTSMIPQCFDESTQNLVTR